MNFLQLTIDIINSQTTKETFNENYIIYKKSFPNIKY